MADIFPLDGYLFVDGIGHLARLRPDEAKMSYGRLARYSDVLDHPRLTWVKLRCGFGWEESDELMQRALDAVDENTAGRWTLDLAAKRNSFIDPKFGFAIEEDAVAFKLALFDCVSPEL